MQNSFELSVVLPASPEQVYKAWLSSEEHSAFTGSQAVIEPEVGGKFTAWDGYILGKNLELGPYHRILQAWRTTDFPADSPDSKLEISLKAVKRGTKLTLVHTEIPEGQAEEYLQGWKDYYFSPMKEYFSK
jgi:activator of HSP90 ATPase